MKKSYLLSRRQLAEFKVRSKRAQRKDQSEICGALVRVATNKLHLRFLPNRATSPGRWEIAYSDVARIRASAQRRQQKFAGYFHSHPISEAVPGRTDIDAVPLSSLMLIYDVCGDEFRLWRILKRGSKKVASSVPFELKR